MPRKTSRDVRRRKTTRKTLRIPKPYVPAPTPPPPPPSPAEQIEQAVQAVVSHEDWRLQQVQPEPPTPLQRSWQAFQLPWQLLGETGKGVVGSLFPGKDIWGGQTGDWRRVLANIQQGLQPYGFGYGPTWGQPGGLLGGPGKKTAAELAAEYGGEPTELWFMREGEHALGGAPGRASEIMQAWAGGGRPLFVPKSAAEILGVHEDQMREAGYGRTLGGSWQLEDVPRPDLQPPPSYGGSYGYTPSRYGYGGGGVRGQAAARGMGLINWRIGI